MSHMLTGKAVTRALRGGGAALFVKPSLTFSVIHIDSTNFESVFIETLYIINKSKTVVGIIYRPPNSDVKSFNNEIELIIKNLTKSKANLILLGDFNINLLNSETHPESEDFLNLLFANTLLPLVTKPTRFGSESTTLIGNIISNPLTNRTLSGVILDDISDHLPVFLIIDASDCPTDLVKVVKRARQIMMLT